MIKLAGLTKRKHGEKPWIETGFTPETAYPWIRGGYEGSEAFRWRAVGFNDPKQIPKALAEGWTLEILEARQKKSL